MLIRHFPLKDDTKPFSICRVSPTFMGKIFSFHKTNIIAPVSSSTSASSMSCFMPVPVMICLGSEMFNTLTLMFTWSIPGFSSSMFKSSSSFTIRLSVSHKHLLSEPIKKSWGSAVLSYGAHLAWRFYSVVVVQQLLSSIHPSTNVRNAKDFWNTLIISNN